MVIFVECTLPSRPYRSSKITNHAVNLALCTSIEKSRIHWYPDNEGIPSIRFKGCDVEWAFNTDAQRDAEFERIMKTSSND